MHINISKSVLENMVTNLQPFLEKKDFSQITSHILFKVTDDSLTTKATDYEIGLLCNTQSFTPFENGEATVNGKKILEIVKRMKDSDIELKSEDGFLYIKQGRSSFKLPTFLENAFPPFPDFENEPKIEINSLNLIHSIKKIIPAIDTNNPKQELNGALIDIKEYAINFVSTDTRRLAIVKYDNPSIDKLSLIIPKKAIIEIQKLFFDDVELYYNKVNLIIKSKNYIFFTKLINGSFPDYEKIIPKSTNENLKLPKDKFIDAIKLINSISIDMKLTFKSSGITFEALSEENSEALTDLEIDLDLNKEYTIAINSRYILDFLSQIDTSEFLIGFSEVNHPFILKSENFHTVVMPIIL